MHYLIYATEDIKNDIGELTSKWGTFADKFVDQLTVAGWRILNAVIIGIIGWYVVKLLAKLASKILHKSKMDVGLADFLSSVIRSGLRIILLVIVIGILGIPLSSIVALVGSAGLAVGLALQGCLTNFAGGVLILILKPFAVGDYILDSKGHEGTVTSIDIIYTKLLTPDNQAVTIPNGNLANDAITNVTREPYRRLEFKVSIDYSEDIKRVKGILEAIALKSDYTLKDKECLAYISSFDPSAVIVALRFWVNTHEYWDARCEIQEEIKRVLDQEGIVIPYNKLDVNLINNS